MGTRDYFVYGEPDVWVKTYSASNVNPVVSNALTTDGWTQLNVNASGTGMKKIITPDGVTISISQEAGDVTLPGVGVIDSEIGAESATISFEMFTHDLELFDHALQGATFAEADTDGSDSDDLTFGGGTMGFVSLAITGENVAGETVCWFFYKCRPTGETSQSHTREGEPAHSVFSFTAIVDIAQTAGSQLGDCKLTTSA